jgi:hypothetical protein
MSIFPDMKTEKMSIKNSNCVSAWTCLVCVCGLLCVCVCVCVCLGRVSVFSMYCHIKTFYKTGMETTLTGRVEEFNLFWIDMKCVM